MQKQLIKVISFTVIMVGVLINVNLNAQQAEASLKTKVSHDNEKVMNELKGWPKASQMAAKEMTDKYGAPDVVSEEVMGWMNKGMWKTIHVTKMESKHSFPVEHTDMMEQCISYRVPVGKMDDLGKFDGSITFDRTQGLMCARCDVEANNFLALNLSNDIATGKLTVKAARRSFGEIVKEKMNGGNPIYMQKLVFTPHGSAPDADINTTGLTKADVMKGGKL